ncbi:uncharacterized protein LOC107808937 [Nicotiana tabacum]|uniref:uncharacterized protein LOC107808937 n=1 Tax=Nicotiana tabacum TaxID=4097 RepID=UPI003F4E9FDC
MHVGKSSSIHNHAKKKCEDLLKKSSQFKLHLIGNPVKPSFRLKASIEVVRLLLNQGLTFRGHHEDESSLNKGNFLEILSWYAGRCNKIRDLVLKKAPKNDQLTSHKIQKDIIIAFDESCDVSRKEQLAIVLRYVNRCGSVVEHFIGIIHVRNTRALCLKEAIVDYIAQHSLSLSYVHGQCYDGASNMQGDFRGLKTLIQQEKKVQEPLDMGELETGRGLNQELGLARAADTRWYNISIPNFDDFYVNSRRSRCKVADHTILHHYRVDIFFMIIDWQVQELNARFNEVTTNLLVGVACLNPVDSFSSFDINKILMMVELYPDDFDENIMVTLKNQLETYIVDVRDVDERFSNLQGLVDLSETLVKTKKHLNYPFVFRLVKFALLLPVAIATVERTFSAMKLIKSELRNRMNDEFMSGCLVPYVERKIFNAIFDETIINTFQDMKTRRGQL